MSLLRRSANRQANRGTSDELLHCVERPIRGRTRAARFARFTAASWRGSEMSEMRYRTLTAALAVLFSVAPSRAQTKTVTLPLDSAEGLKPVNAKVEPVMYKG